MVAMPLILAVLGFALLILEVLSFRANRSRSRGVSKRNQIIYVACTTVAGILLAYGSLYFEYRLRSDLRVFGVPFPTAVFQFERGRWVDFTGVITLPAMLGNALVAFLLPQLLVAGATRIRRSRSSVTPESRQGSSR